MPEDEKDIDPYVAMSMADLEKATSEGSDRYVGADIAAGIIGGLINGVEGIAETGTMLVDLFAGTKWSRDMNLWVDEMKEHAGLTAHGAAGEMAESVGEILTYIFPMGAAARVGSVAARAGMKALAGPGTKLAQSYLRKNIGKSSAMIDLIRREGPKIYASKMGKRMGQFVGTGLGAGLADSLILHDGRTLVTDYFTPDGWDEVLDPLRSEKYTDDLSPREDALRRIRNKLRAGAEGVGGYSAFKGIGLGFKGVGAMGHIIGADEFIGRHGAKLGKNIGIGLEKAALRQDDSVVSKVSRQLLEWKNPYGLAGKEFDDLATSHRGDLRAIAHKSKQVMEGINENIHNLIHGKDGKYSEWLAGMEPHEKDVTREMLARYFDPSISDDMAEQTLSGAARLIHQIPEIRGSIRKLQENLIEQLERVNYGSKSEIAAKVDQVVGSFGKYAHRSYQLWDNFKFRAPKGKDRAAVIQKLHDLVLKGVNPNATLEDAEIIANSIWKNKETFTTAANRRYNSKTLAGGLEELEKNINIYEEGVDLATPKGRMDRIERLSDTEVATGGAGSGALKARGHVDHVLRDIYGEYTNPQSVAINTIKSVAADTANLKFMNDIDAMGLKALDGQDLVKVPKAGSAPEIGYKDVPNTPLRFGNLAGKRVHASIADEILQSYKINPTFGDKVWGALFTMKGAFQANKTIWSPLTGFGNVVSNIVPTAARMNYFRGGGSLRESMALVIRQVRNTSSQEDLKMLSKAAGLNLSDSIVDLNQSLDLLEEGLRRGNFSIVDNIGRALSGKSDVSPTNIVGKTFRWLQTKAQELYRGEDDMFKLFNYFAEKAKYSEVLPWMDSVALNSQRTGLSILDLIAAGNVRSMLPSFDRMPRIMKQLRKIPFAGNFSSFAAESIRTSFNGIHMGLNEMAGRFRYANEWIDLDIFRPGNEKLLNETASRLGWVKPGETVNFQQKVFRKNNGQFMSRDEINSLVDYSKGQLAKIGTRSVIGNLAAQSSMAYSIPAIGSMMTGVSKDEVDSFRRDMAHSWDANGSIVPIGRRHDGGPGFEYVNLAPINYYTTMQSTVKAFINEFARSQKEGKGDVVSASRAAIDSMLTFADPFLGLSVPIEKLVDVGARNGRTREGSIVFSEHDMLGTVLAKSLAHVANAYNPGISPVSFKWDSSFLEGVKRDEGITDIIKRYGNAMFTPGPAVRGALVTGGVEGFDRDKFGWKVEPLRQFLPYMVRLRSQIADPVQALEYRGHELTRLSRSIAHGFTRSVENKPMISSDEVLSAFISGQVSLFNAHKAYASKMETAGKMGMSKNDVRNLLFENNVGHRAEILAGNFPPLVISNDMDSTLRGRGLGHVIGIANALSSILSDFDVSEPTETFEQVIQEVLSGDVPPETTPVPLGQPLSSAGQPLSSAGQPLSSAGQPLSSPGQPLSQAPVPQFSDEELSAAMSSGAPSLPIQGRKKRNSLMSSKALLPNPKDLALAEALGLADEPPL